MKEKNGEKHIGLILVSILTALAVLYVGFAIFFQSHFCFGTSIDGISVGGSSVKKTQNLIREEIDGYTLELTGREGEKETMTGSSFRVSPVFSGEIEQLLESQNGFFWPAVLFGKQELELTKTVSFDEKALGQVLSELSCTQPQNQREPVNAGYSDYNHASGYELIEADYGTKINMTALKEAVKKAVEALEDTLDLDAAGCYVNPQVGNDDKELIALLEDFNRYAGTEITYIFDDQKEVLDGTVIHTWLSEDEKRKVAVDQEAVTEYVKELGKKYNTAYQPKTFMTSYGKEITISGGFYGWRIDREGEVAQILSDMEAGTATEREPVYSQTANSHGENDYGDSYVEINLTAQHLFVYKDGKLVIETDFVSGDVADGHSSPSGAFGLTYKTENAILRGPDYETPVNYWMPFAGDVGMHDATWRRSFGGNIYKTNGSHGCINLPLSAAKTIYGVMEKGYAVLVYTLPGTESVTVQQQDAAAIVGIINAIGEVTLESEEAVESARNLYNALPESAKGYVTNYDMLTAAEAALAQLKAAAAPPPEGVPEQQPEQQPEGVQ